MKGGAFLLRRIIMKETKGSISSPLDDVEG
jgi:hypothetical protein